MKESIKMLLLPITFPLMVLFGICLTVFFALEYLFTGKTSFYY